VTFDAQALFMDNGSGMHVHQSLWKGGSPLFFRREGLRRHLRLARWYIGGLLKHASTIIAFTNPTTNSFKRLVPGYEAPVNLVYSQRNRSAAVRIPLYSQSPKAKRLEFRCPDPSCTRTWRSRRCSWPPRRHPEQGGAADPGRPGPLRPPTRGAGQSSQVPGSLDEALDALEADHDFLLAGDVFTPDVIETWIAYKRESEIDAMRLRPHPYEFYLYYDI